MLKDAVNNLFNSQLESWSEFNERVKQLDNIDIKEFKFNNYTIKVQYNPAREVSSNAKLDAKSIAERKCFLCRENQPEVQESIKFNEDFLILVNPFPILKGHLTIPLKEHKKQEILPYTDTLLELAKELDSHTILYNGPKCGASAPDHMHFQAVSKGQLSLENEYKNVTNRILSENKFGHIKELRDYGRKCILIESLYKDVTISLFKQIYAQLAYNKEDEPMMNIFCFYDEDGWHLFMFLRKTHRPTQFFSEGDDYMMISPGAIDVAGVIVLPRKADFDKIDRKTIIDVYNQVSL